LFSNSPLAGKRIKLHSLECSHRRHQSNKPASAGDRRVSNICRPQTG